MLSTSLIIIQQCGEPFSLIHPGRIMRCLLHRSTTGRAHLTRLVKGCFAGRADIFISSEQMRFMNPIRRLHNTTSTADWRPQAEGIQFALSAPQRGLSLPLDAEWRAGRTAPERLTAAPGRHGGPRLRIAVSRKKPELRLTHVV